MSIELRSPCLLSCARKSGCSVVDTGEIGVRLESAVYDWLWVLRVEISEVVVEPSSETGASSIESASCFRPAAGCVCKATSLVTRPVELDAGKRFESQVDTLVREDAREVEGRSFLNATPSIASPWTLPCAVRGRAKALPMSSSVLERAPRRIFGASAHFPPSSSGASPA